MRLPEIESNKMLRIKRILRRNMNANDKNKWEMNQWNAFERKPYHYVVGHAQARWHRWNARSASPVRQSTRKNKYPTRNCRVQHAE